MSHKVSTASGRVDVNDLGRVLMHEHVTLKMAGSEANTLHPGPDRTEILARSLDWIAQLQDRGIGTIVDPAPADMGRDLELCAELGARTGLNIICATGLFNEYHGGTAYWKLKRDIFAMIGDPEGFGQYLAEVFVNEIENGVGPSKVRCGIIKIAGGSNELTNYEEHILKAAAMASLATGCPITTHSDDGYLGRTQQAALLALGVPADRIVIGHSCNVNDHDYHRHIVEHGSFIGFDRFGFQSVTDDESRMDGLVRLLRAGHAERIVIANDACFCWAEDHTAGLPPVPEDRDPNRDWSPIRVSDVILPALRERGVTEVEIDTILIDNPRRYFAAGQKV